MENLSIKLPRQCVDIEDFERFKIPESTSDKQYSNIYNARLEALREVLVIKAKEKWVHRRIIRIQDLSGVENEEFVIIIGTVYKHQELKPSVLKELCDELQLKPQPTRSNYSSEKDHLFFEDETRRIQFAGNCIDPREMVSGLVCAILGQRLDDETLWAEDYCMPGICPKISRAVTSTTREKKCLLFLSGLDLGNDMESIAYELVIEFINGMAGNNCTYEIEATIAQVIVIGNNASSIKKIFTHQCFTKEREKNSVAGLGAVLATNKFDNLLSQILATCGVIVLPAQFDPSNHTIPQKPFHSCILPKSSRYKTLHAATNPWIGRLGNRIVAGSSGQPIENIMKIAGLSECSPLEWLEKTLIWRHFAPTAPDTLPAYSYFDGDPFIMQECPDIYFVGNMEKYATKLAVGDEGQTVRLITIPKFSQSHTAVVVDLESLNTWPISFGQSQ